MFVKLFAVPLVSVAVVPAFAALTVTSVTTDLRGSTYSNADLHSYSSQLMSGIDSQFVSSSMGTASGYANGYAYAYQAGNSAYGYSYSESYSSVHGAGTSKASATTYTRVKFTLTEDSVLSYNVTAQGNGWGQTKNGASIRFAYDASAGGGPLPSAEVGDNLTGTIALAAGNYFVELYNRSKTYVKSGSANSFGDAYSYGESSFSFTAQAVPEPASMAVLAIGALALLRRRKTA